MENLQRNDEEIVALDSFLNQGEFDKALSLGETYLQNMEKPPSFRAQVFSNIYNALRGLKREEQAILTVAELAKVWDTAIKKVPTDKEKADLKLEKGRNCVQLGVLLRTVEPEILWALNFYNKNKDAWRKQIIECLRLLVAIYFKRSDYDKAIEYLKEYEKLIVSEYERATYFGLLGRILMLKGDFDEAERNLLEANKIYENIGEKGDISDNIKNWLQRNLPWGWLELGYIYTLKINFEKAKEYLDKAYNIIKTWNPETIDFVHTKCVYLEFLGFLAYSQDNNHLAHKCYQKVFNLMDKTIPMDAVIAQTSRFLAELLVAEKKYQKALDACEKGFKSASVIDQKIEIGSISKVQGQIFAALGDTQKANECFQDSVRMQEKIGAKYELARTYLVMGRSDAYRDYDKYNYQDKAKDLFAKMGIEYYASLSNERYRKHSSRIVKKEDDKRVSIKPNERYVFEVFLCYNSEDRPVVKGIGIRLKQHGISPWFDEWELRPGLPWQQVLEEQIGKIKSAAVFVGKNGIGPWQNLEQAAFLREFVKRKCPVIPVLLEGTKKIPKLPLFLEGMTWVDFQKKKPDPFEQLIWGITGKHGSSQKNSKSSVAQPA